MPTLLGQIDTERASRYLVQFCKHAAAMGGGHMARMHRQAADRREVQVSAEWSDVAGTVTFVPWGRCTLTAGADTLTVRIDAVDDDGLTRIRDVIERDLQRFSRRSPLTVNWRRSEAAGIDPTPSTGFPRPAGRTVLLAVAVIVVLALHAGMAGAVVAGSRWTDVAVSAVMALVVVKIALIVWARYATRRGRITKTPD